MISADYLNSEEILNILNKFVEENKKVQVDDEISIELKKWKLKENNEYLTFNE